MLAAKATNEDSLAGEVSGRIIRSKEKLGADIVEDTHANEMYSQLIFGMGGWRMAWRRIRTLSVAFYINA